MTAPEGIVFIRSCAFCGGEMDGSVPECMVSVVPRHPPSVHYVGHTECFRRTLSPTVASQFDPADARP